MNYESHTPAQIVRELRYCDQQLAATRSAARRRQITRKRELLQAALARKAARGQCNLAMAGSVTACACRPPVAARPGHGNTFDGGSR